MSIITLVLFIMHQLVALIWSVGCLHMLYRGMQPCLCSYHALRTKFPLTRLEQRMHAKIVLGPILNPRKIKLMCQLIVLWFQGICTQKLCTCAFNSSSNSLKIDISAINSASELTSCNLSPCQVQMCPWCSKSPASMKVTVSRYASPSSHFPSNAWCLWDWAS